MLRFALGFMIGVSVSFFIDVDAWKELSPENLSEEIRLERLLEKIREDVSGALKETSTFGESFRERGPEAEKKYYVQLGSFSSVNNADRMRAAIILEGYTQQTIFVNTAGPGWHRVLIGPFDQKREAEKAIVDTTARGLSGLMIRGVFL